MAEANETDKSSASGFRTTEPLVSWQTALHRFVAGVRLAYGARLSRIVLYGSHARGDDEPGSDVDVLVVLNECPNFWVEHRRLGDISYEASIGAETIVSARPIAREEFERRQSPLLLNIHREGVDIT